MEHSEFKKAAEKRQIEYKEKYFGTTCDKFYKHKENGKLISDKSKPIRYYLTDKDGKAGKNYYNQEVFEAVLDRFQHIFDYKRDSNMLRSEHIPFNLFIPLKKDLEFCKRVFNEILGGEIINKIEKILIEHAPSPKENYLNDRTSFDAYIEYTHTDKSKGIIGIEVKYTEKEYPLVKFEKDKETGERKITKAWQDVEDFKNKKEDSIYLNVTTACKLYKEEHFMNLVENKYRQIWRNHLLAESILLVDKDEFKHAHSLIFYPKCNEHFAEAGEQYAEMLVDNKDSKFGVVTFENFIEKCRKHCPNNEFKNWIDYLQERYIVFV